MSVMCEANQKTHPWCKVCLVSNVRMCSIENLQILEIYGKLTNTQQIQDEMPQALCYICYSLLQKAHRFADMAHKSQNILEDMRRQGVEACKITIMPNFGIAPNLSATDISVTSVPNYKNTQVTDEHTAVKVEATCEVEEINTEEICTVPEEEEIFENVIDKRHDVENILQETRRTNICSKIFSQQGSSIQSYIRIYNGEKPYVCNICSKAFRNKHNLKSHTRTHTGEKPYVCNICSKAFAESCTLKSHTRTHTGEKLYVCNICSKAFRKKHNLKSHTRTHTGEKPYVCNICSKAFAESCTLKSHTRTHTGEKPYVCNICSKAFRESCSLKSHTRTHTGEKPYKCKMCIKTFSYQASLQNHIRTHTGEKPYNCNTCSKSFSRQEHLQRHMKTHTGEKPQICNICSKSFSRQDHLQRHMRTHNGEKPFECKI